jgi:hypothetical protein
MAGEDQQRLEDFLALERYIEALRAGRVAHVPAELTPDLARIYGMAMSFHAASTGAAAPRPEFIAELQAKLKHVEAIHRAPLKGHRHALRKNGKSTLVSLDVRGFEPEPSLLLRSQSERALSTPWKSRNEQRSPLPFPSLPPGCPWSLLISLRPSTLWRRSTSWVSSQCRFVRVESSATWFATTVRAAIRRTARSLPCPPPACIWAVW